MNEKERPLSEEPRPDLEAETGSAMDSGATSETPSSKATAEEVTPVEGAVEQVTDTVELAAEEAAAAAAEAQQAMEELAQVATEAKQQAAQARSVARQAVSGQYSSTAAGGDDPDRLADALSGERVHDESATPDDRLLAAISYASQLVIPLIVPIILLVSETSKKRPFQRYHAMQSLALSIALWVAEAALGVFATIAAATIIGVLCLCVIVPLMIVLWLLPLYYAVLAYGGQRFTIPGLTQFLKDQGWL